MIVDHLEKCCLFSDFKYDFSSSWSTADLLTVVLDRIARAFNRSGATSAVAHDIWKVFERAWHACLLHKLKALWNFGSYFCLLSLLDGFNWFWMGGLHENTHLMLELLKAPFLVQHFLPYINELPDDVICNIAIYVQGSSNLIFVCTHFCARKMVLCARLCT